MKIQIKTSPVVPKYSPREKSLNRETGMRNKNICSSLVLSKNTINDTRMRSK
jgi:hypothetical protein